MGQEIRYVESKNQLRHYVRLSYVQKLSTALNTNFFLFSLVAAVGSNWDPGYCGVM
jgi:hypothetical protein